jgi:hypothetical protein
VRAIERENLIVLVEIVIGFLRVVVAGIAEEGRL